MHDKAVQGPFEEGCEHDGNSKTDGRPEEKERCHGFSGCWIFLPQSIGDARFGQIVRGHFETDAVADGEPDEMPAHFAGNMGEDFVLVIQHDPKHRARQNRLNGPFQFNWLFTAHTVLH